MELGYSFYVLALLLGAHFICDYPLQGDFLAKFKSRLIDGKPHEFWLHAITAHSAIHAVPVLLVTQSLFLALFMFATHWLIDTLKCEKQISLLTDQLLHILVILIITYTFTM